jgi:hypothetical protein
MRFPALIVALVALLAGCARDSVWKQQTFAFALPNDPPATTRATNVLSLSHVSISPLFQTRWFTYRIGDDAYERDPYAGFLVPPERAIAESIRACLRASDTVGTVLEPGSALAPTLVAEVSVSELYGDFRDASRPTGVLSLHFILYSTVGDAPSRVVLDKTVSRQSPMSRKNPAALMAAWNADLREILGEITSDYAKANLNDR